MIAKACACPGCGAARAHDECPNQIHAESALVVHRWSGTATDRNGPGSAAHRGGRSLQIFIASAALRRARDLSCRGNDW